MVYQSVGAGMVATPTDGRRFEALAITPWRATCIQMPSVLATAARSPADARGIIDANVACAIRMIEAALASDLPPKLVVLPEFALQGPPHGETVAEWIEKACDTLPGRATAPLQDLARRRGIFIGGNLFETDPRWAGRFFNCCFLIDPLGDVILRFRRINTAMWPSPHDFLDAYLAEHGWGGVYPVVDTELGRLAMIACGEIAVPEVARMLMLHGAEVILHPTNEPMNPAQEAAKVARAAENMVFLVSANVADGIGFSRDGSVPGGRSHIINYRGDSLAFEGGAAATTSVTATLDVAALRTARRDLGLGNTLLRARFDMYRPFYAAASFYPANQFLDRPMADASAAGAVSRIALDNLRKAGVVAEP
jgi:predicted amidohydrolase